MFLSGGVVPATTKNEYVAAGAYLEYLRKDKKMSRQGLATHFGTSRSQIERIEWGQQGTRAPMWFQVAEYLEASIIHLARLLSKPNIPKQEGVDTAKWWLALTEEQRNTYRALLKTDEGRESLLLMAMDLSDDPILHAEARGYLASLQERRRQQSTKQ
jgi:transcriptional regulator with XRE-family HTH domain